MKKYLILLVMVSKLFSQTDTTDYSEYFPLEVGNSWQYHESDWVSGVDKYVMFTITGDTIVLNGIQYYTVKWEPSSSIIRFNYLRFDTAMNAICTFIDSQQRDTIMFDFDLDMNDTIYYREYYPGDLVYVDTFTENIQFINQSISCLKYNFYYEATWLRTYYIAKGFGLFYMDSGFKWLEQKAHLNAVKIKGVTYGDFVSIDKTESQINSFTLARNYPNPFNSTTKISFSLPKKSVVNISIYDIRGRLVQELVDRAYEEGLYTLNWDAGGVQSGVYMIKMKTNDFSFARKCLLIK